VTGFPGKEALGRARLASSNWPHAGRKSASRRLLPITRLSPPTAAPSGLSAARTKLKSIPPTVGVAIGRRRSEITTLRHLPVACLPPNATSCPSGLPLPRNSKTPCCRRHILLAGCFSGRGYRLGWDGGNHHRQRAGLDDCAAAAADGQATFGQISDARRAPADCSLEHLPRDVADA
jgi:hypothetical protein